jgi:hypothetical protein
VTKPYHDLLDTLIETDKPFVRLSLQFAFILYLLAGQVLALLLWRLFAPSRAGEPSRLKSIFFALYLLVAQVTLFVGWPFLVGAWQTASPILLADIVVTFHLVLVLAVPVALLLILIGWPFGWKWTRHFWFRLAQLIVIEVVAGQAIVGIECPLKTIERHLRGGYDADGESLLHNLDEASAIGAWCNQLLYYDAEASIFMWIYASVALLVLLTWILAPPLFPWRAREEPSAG